VSTAIDRTRTPARPSLKEQLQENERLLAETGCLFGLERLGRKESDPGTYEAVWHILLNICNTGWTVGCKVSRAATRSGACTCRPARRSAPRRASSRTPACSRS
jgi:hypothetical protein